MKSLKLAAFWATSILAVSFPAFSATPSTPESGQALVTILPESGPELTPVSPSPQSMHLKINGKTTEITSVTHARGEESPLEVVVLIDSGAHGSLATQFQYIKDFAEELPSSTQMAIAYMENGRAVFSVPLSSDPKQIIAGLRIPPGPAGISGSPYFCLSDLAKHWPSSNPNARREVIMISDGIDNYEPRYNPDDQYVQAAINDSIRSGLTVYSIYWSNRGGIGDDSSYALGGQSLLLQVTDATGGYSYWQGTGNPVSFAPYFKDLRSRFEHQFRIRFKAMDRNKPEVLSMNLKLTGLEAKLSAPKRVLVGPSSGK
ncbi:MAG: hypothetical protein KGN79_14110 [Acidobacteriota bacterium]|nr:hypothetical protein [Acidobacteriota bacterium]